MRGQVKEWWGKLTDDDLDQAGGKADQIVGLLQQKYGYTHERAEEEFNRRLKEAKIKHSYGKWRIEMGILSWIIVGLIAGWLAGKVMSGGGYGLVGDIVVGVIGGLLGGWIASSLLHLGAGVNGINLESILVAFAGAVILLVALRALGGSRRSILR